MTWQAASWASKQKAGSVQAKAVLLGMANCASVEGVCFAEQKTLSDIVELSEKGIRRNLRRLMDVGLVRVFERRITAGSREAGRRRSNVVVLMMPPQWHHRSKGPVACDEYFSGHDVTEKSTDLQQIAFAEQTLADHRSKGPVVNGTTGHCGPDQGSKGPVVQNGNSDGKALNEKAKAPPDGESPPDSSDPQYKTHTKLYTGSPSGDASVDEAEAPPDDPDEDGDAQADEGADGGAVFHVKQRQSDEPEPKPGTLAAWWRSHWPEFETAIGKHDVQLFLADVIPASNEAGVLTLWTKSRFDADWIRQRFSGTIRRVCKVEQIAIGFDERAQMQAARKAKRLEEGGSVKLAKPTAGGE